MKKLIFIYSVFCCFAVVGWTQKSVQKNFVYRLPSLPSSSFIAQKIPAQTEYRLTRFVFIEETSDFLSSPNPTMQLFQAKKKTKPFSMLADFSCVDLFELLHDFSGWELRNTYNDDVQELFVDAPYTFQIKLQISL